MKVFARLFRLVRINYIIARYNLDEIILGTRAFSFLHFLIYLNPWYWALKNKYSRGARLRMALEKLGPIYVKVGQILATRRDLIPDDIAEQLALLQDKVPPFPGKIAKKIVEASLNNKLENVFITFDLTALASASVAQVHAATLFNGQEVVVKVLRPQIRKMIEQDIDLLMTLANIAQRYWFRFQHFKPQSIIQEIAQTLYDELDLQREGANATQLKRNFAHSTALYIPKIYWEYCRSNILVMERIHGTPIYDVKKLQTLGINLDHLAERLIEIFFTQIFRDNFFHADLHPGNLFVSNKNTHDPQIIAVDFGIVGSLNQRDQRYIAENMVAFFKRDYQRVAELHIACGWLPPDTRVDQFEGAIRAVSEPIFEKPLKDISFGQLLLRLFQVARHFHIRIQPQLVLLQKTLLGIESLSRQLSPNLDLWVSGTPHLEDWLKKQVGFKAFLKRIKNNLPLWSEQLPALPGLMYEVLSEKKHQQEVIKFSQGFLSARDDLRISPWRYFLWGMSLSAFIVSFGGFWYALIPSFNVLLIDLIGLIFLILGYLV